MRDCLQYDVNQLHKNLSILMVMIVEKSRGASPISYHTPSMSMRCTSPCAGTGAPNAVFGPPAGDLGLRYSDVALIAWEPLAIVDKLWHLHVQLFALEL